MVVTVVSIICAVIGMLVGMLLVVKNQQKAQEKSFVLQLAAMKAEFESTSRKLLAERSEEFKGANRETMEHITKPLLQELDHMRKQLGETKESSEKLLNG